MNRIILPIIIILLSLNLAMATSSDKIVGGGEIKPEEVPWHVHLHHWRAVCSGVLISDRHILTAGHCLRKRYAKRYQVKAGGSGQWRDLKTIGTIAKIDLHEGFHPKHLVHDIGLITLSSPVKFSKTIQPISLVGNDFDLYELINGERYKRYLVTGYGVTDGGNRSQTLKYTDTLKPLPPFTDRKFWNVEMRMKHLGIKEEVTTLFSEEMTYQANWIISRKVDSSACSGDSGGPAVVYDTKAQKHILVGLTSWGSMPCANYEYGINFHVNVSEYLDWIKSKL